MIINLHFPLGFCPFYHQKIGRIFNDVDRPCKSFETSPCPERYNSSDVFKGKIFIKSRQYTVYQSLYLSGIMDEYKGTI